MSSVESAAKAIVALAVAGFAVLAASIGWIVHHERRMETFCQSIQLGSDIADIMQLARREGLDPATEAPDEEGLRVLVHGQRTPFFRTGCVIRTKDGKVLRSERLVND
jgi:hypothetical protein